MSALRTLPHKIHAVRLVRSPIGQSRDMRKTLELLNLTRLHQVAFHKNTPTVNGMLNKVVHLVEVSPVVFQSEKGDGEAKITSGGQVTVTEEQLLALFPEKNDA
eukprot:m.359018 g.359018  ORF g.359018 m.359018 type:complete len:104 (+) comp18372_c0_seq1:73-384(+)